MAIRRASEEYRKIREKLISEDFMQKLFVELTEQEYREEQENCILIPPKHIKRAALYSAAYEES